MSYTRKCNGKTCEAMLEWNEEQEWYEDSLFPGQKHDHARFAKAASQTTEVSQEASVPATEKIEGTVCKKCEAAGFPNQIIFFNDAVRGPKTKRVIPLEHAEKINGEWVYHEHKTQDSPAQQAPVLKESAVTKPVDEAPPVNSDNINETIKAWTHELRQHNQWMEWIKPQVETVVGYIMNEKTIKKAAEQ